MFGQTRGGADIRPSGSLAAQAVSLAMAHDAAMKAQTTAPHPSKLAPRSNAVAGTTHRQALRDALSTVAEVVGRTLGPHGAQTLVAGTKGDHFATKDGYTVLRYMQFVQETAMTVLDHVRSISRSVVRRVGDGSTSAVVMADALYSSFDDEGVYDRFPPGAVQAAMSACADVLVNRIQQHARRIEPGSSELEAVATIAANNDPTLGRTVASIFKQHGAGANVTVAEADSGPTRFVPEPGYRVLRGMAHESFANESVTDEASPSVCRLRNAAVMVIGERVTMPTFVSVIAPAMNEVIGRGIPFVAVAREWEDAVIETVARYAAANPAPGVLLVDHSMASRRSRARLGDLAALVGASVLDPSSVNVSEASKLATQCGTALDVRSTKSETVFVVASRPPEAIRRANELMEQIARVEPGDHGSELADELDELELRRKALIGTEVHLLAGGDTPQERRALRYRLEDAALAASAALRSGVVEGMGMTALRELAGDVQAIRTAVLEELLERSRLPEEEASALATWVVSATTAAYREAASRVLRNARRDPEAVLVRCLGEGVAYDALRGSYHTVGAFRVLCPVDTDVEVLRGAMSIVALLATSDQTLLTRPAAGAGLD